MATALRFLCPVLFLAGLCGCGDRNPKATVKGRVTYEGQPVARGQVAFYPTDGRGGAEAAPIRDGTYEIRRLTPGPKRVQVTAFRDVPERAHPPSEEGQLELAKQAEGLSIPPDAVGNNVTVEVVPGSQTLDFSLTKPVPKGPASPP